MPLTLRLVKGAELTYAELDGNFLFITASFLPTSSFIAFINSYNTGSFQGTLDGNATSADTASYVDFAQTALTADTASYVEIAQSASNAEKVTVTNVTTSMGGPWYPMFTSTSNGVNAIVSVDTNQYIYTPTTNTLTVTASQAISASYAPPSNPFPYTGSAEILGTLGVTGSTTITDLSDTAKTKISADYIAMYNPSATFDIWLSGSGNNETTVYSGGPADLTIHSDQKLRINATSTEITGSVNITGSINSTGSIALGDRKSVV